MLRFKDMMTAEYLPGEDELVNYRAYRRKRTIGVGEGGPIGESNENPVDAYMDAGKHSKNTTLGYKTKNVKLKFPKTKHTITVHQLASEDVEVDESLSIAARLQKGRDIRRNKAKLELGRARAARRFASSDVLERRARKAAYKLFYNRITKNVPADELSPQRKAEIEKRLESPAFKTRIARLATKMLKDVRKKEIERKQAKGS